MNKRQTLEQLLENTRQALKNPVDQSQPDPKILLPVIRRIMPKLIAQGIIGAQPMTRRSLTMGELEHACSTWYWACPPESPAGIFEIEKTRQYYHDIESWIEERCGPKGSWNDADCRWWASNGQYIFKNEQDRTMFVLRWS